MNKLKKPLLTKKSWGSELIFTLTDKYMVKMVELPKNSIAPLIVCETKEKTIVVEQGTLYLTYGKFGSNKYNTETLPRGYFWHIDPGTVHRYQSKRSFVRVIEVSTSQLEADMVVMEPTVEPEEKEKLKKKKRKRRTKKNNGT